MYLINSITVEELNENYKLYINYIISILINNNIEGSD